MAVTTITIEGEAQVIVPNALPVPPSQDATDERFAYSVERAALATDLSESFLRQRIASSELKVRRAGTRVIILPDDLLDFLRNLPEARTEG